VLAVRLFGIGSEVIKRYRPAGKTDVRSAGRGYVLKDGSYLGSISDPWAILRLEVFFSELEYIDSHLSFLVRRRFVLPGQQGLAPVMRTVLLHFPLQLTTLKRRRAQQKY